MATKQIVFDTDVLIDYWNTKSKRHQETKQHLEHSIGLDNVIISVITQMELIAGARNKAEESKINKKLSRFNIARILYLLMRSDFSGRKREIQLA
jgi:predicted nucleic acid-binding protein